jgi:hypothetical protein
MTAKEQGKRLLKYITKERKDVLNIYFYAILSGLVQLSLPLEYKPSSVLRWVQQW